MDESTKREILDPIMAAIHAAEVNQEARHYETHGALENVVRDQVAIRAEIAGLVVRVEALEGRASANENRLSGHERSIKDNAAAAKREASEVRHELAGAVDGITARFTDLSGGMANLASELHELRTGLDKAVLQALAKHVAKIEHAADKLSRSPQVRTAASIGGAFAGSALVAALIELAKHL